MSGPIAEQLRRTARAWRRARALATVTTSTSLALLAVAVSALLLDLLGPPGLTPSLLGYLLLWLLLPLIAGISRLLIRPPATMEVATALDRRAGLEDRLGTALEFREDNSAIASLQRTDAERSCDGLEPESLFPGPGARHAWTLALCAILALTSAGLALSLDLHPERPNSALSPTPPEQDLLAAIERDRRVLLEGGEKDRAQLLTDLEARIRRIRSREQELRKVVQQRTQPEPSSEEAKDQEEPPPQAAESAVEREDTPITAAELDALEAEAMGELVLGDAQQAEIVADLFRQTRAARTLTRHFDEIAEKEMELGHEHRAESQPPTVDAFQDQANEAIQSTDAGQNAAPIQDRQNEADALSRRELDGESMAEHDRAHDYQESFNEFLRDFVKDVRELLQEAGDSRKKAKGKEQKGREVSVGGGDGVADKKNSMEDTGFEEMGDVKRGAHPGEANGDMSDGASMKTDPSQMPEGTGATAANASATTGGGDTSPGGEGAGRGGSDNVGLQAMMDAYVDPAEGPLERVLGQLSQGKLPEERRELLFDRLARHKVQSSGASEADDVLVDYFAEAEATLADDETDLPPVGHTSPENLGPIRSR
ncbi:MAG: hypothetical protein CL928_10090, partial [Deltaproteobacteria bacterium]|nr:hypothetical protein [Deltaproteobacteria bacterium]